MALLPKTLFDLFNAVGIDRETGKNLKKEDVLLWEKKMRAHVKLNGDFSVQLLEKATKALKDFLPQVVQVYDFPLLYHLFYEKKLKGVKYAQVKMYPEKQEQMVLFFEACLNEDINSAFEKWWANQDYKTLAEWGQIVEFFGAVLKQKYVDRVLYQWKKIITVLEKQPSTSYLKEHIPYARSKYFYRFSGLVALDECEKELFQIFYFYEEHHSFTKANDFTHKILMGAHELNPEDLALAAQIEKINYLYGGRSYTYAVGITVLILASVWLILWLLLRGLVYEEPGVDRPFTPDEKRINEFYEDFQKLDSIHCADFTDTLNFITGDNLLAHRKDLSYPKLPKREGAFEFVNKTNFPVVVLPAAKVHYSVKKRMYLPQRLGLNAIYVEAGESIFLDRYTDYFKLYVGRDFYLDSFGFGACKKPRVAKSLLRMKFEVNSEKVGKNAKLVLTGNNAMVWTLDWYGDNRSAIYERTDGYYVEKYFYINAIY